MQLKKSEVFYSTTAYNQSALIAQAVQIRAEAFIAAGRQVIITGDLNISPQLVDHCSPDLKNFLSNRPDRCWLQSLTKPGCGAFVDGFSMFHPDR